MTLANLLFVFHKRFITVHPLITLLHLIFVLTSSFTRVYLTSAGSISASVVLGDYMLGCDGICNMLTSVGVCRHLLEYTDIGWSMQTSAGVCYIYWGGLYCIRWDVLISFEVLLTSVVVRRVLFCY